MKKRSRSAIRRPTSRPSAAPKRAPAARHDRTLESLVGQDTYRVWVKMLAALVPHGRTHRLAPLIGGMLQYAAAAAEERFGSNPPDGSAAASLLEALEANNPESAAAELGDIVERLFRDAKVAHVRVNARGDAYSVADAAVAEFVQWDLMPWE